MCLEDARSHMWERVQQKSLKKEMLKTYNFKLGLAEFPDSHEKALVSTRFDAQMQIKMYQHLLYMLRFKKKKIDSLHVDFIFEQMGKEEQDRLREAKSKAQKITRL